MKVKRNNEEDKTMKDKKQIEIRKNNKEDKVMECKEKNYNPCAKDKEVGRTKKVTCEICGRTYYSYKGGLEGSNADPLRYKRCCPVCEEFIVIPARAIISVITREVQEGRGAEREEILAEENRKLEKMRGNKNVN